MKTKKKITKEVEIKGTYTTSFDQSETVFLVRETNVNHGSWNYSENINQESKEDGKIKHETINFTF